MQSPITIGTILQNRYCIIHVIGQWEFGKIYLAEDQRRFNELCAIKELILTTTEVMSPAKAQELFEREAAILHQIEHPQIPKFREKFTQDQDQKLFLVEDYIPGKSYYALWAERQAVGQAFTEVEVLQLLRSLLPILHYIHSCGIIHRDISPENIILRDSDGKPILTNFGLVKELATRFQSVGSIPITNVGKWEYYPNEQIQTRNVYAHSDLYALAVTAIVLLTGREPANLFDQTRSTWTWQEWVRIDPKFAQVLQRMLNSVPGERYQTANQALEALNLINLDINLDNVANFANLPNSSSSTPEPVVTSPATTSVLDNPLAIGAISAMIIIIAGFGSWAFVNSLRNQTKQVEEKNKPQTFPSPIIASGIKSFSATPGSGIIPEPTKTAPLIVRNKSIKLIAANTMTISNHLQENQVIRYNFIGKAGQNLTVYVDQGLGILLNVFTVNHRSLDNQSPQIASFETTLPNNGKYIIQLNLAPKVVESEYSLSVTLEDPLKFKSTPKIIHHLPKTMPTTTPSSLLPIPSTSATPTMKNGVEPSNPAMNSTPTPTSGI